MTPKSTEIRINRFFSDCRGSYFLFGPRGTGKSTWLGQRYKDALLIDMLEPEAFRLYNSRPERFRDLVEGNLERRTFIVDEIQRTPDLLPVVHALMERHKDRQFILTGSSSRKLKRKGTDLLAGRALVRTMHPFMASELGDRFEINDVLRTGLVPVIYFSPSPREALNAYITLYLKEEVQSEGLVRNIGNFSRFLEAASFSHACILNITNIAHDCQVERRTVQGYMDVLYDLLLAFTVPSFTKRAKRNVTRTSKFYLMDTGVYRALRPTGPLDRPQEIEGVALEGLVAQHVRAWIEYTGRDVTLYYWRTKSGVEVDFVVYGEDTFVALEVKHTATIRPADLKGLRHFGQDYPEAERVLLYRGNNQLNIDGIQCVPCDAFLQRIVPGQPLQ